MNTFQKIRSKFHYECVNCGNEYDNSQVRYLCPVCSQTNSTQIPPKGVLKTVYNTRLLLDEGISFGALKQNGFLDLLPLTSLKSLPILKVGDTPLYAIKQFEDVSLPFNLFLKDDSQNPTYSFKDRASAVVSAYAKEHGIDTIIAASTGNAGSSLAGICASQGQKAIVVVPESAPIAKLTQILMYGATIVPVQGTYDDAFELSIKATEEFGWYNRNTAFNPLTIEGKKTVAFELFEQLNFKVPDKIFVAVGDGVILSGLYKGFEDLLKLGFIDHLPTVVAIQSEGSNNLIRNLKNDDFVLERSNTLADSIAVDVPRNFFMARNYLLAYKGEMIAIPDDKIIEASHALSRNTGLFAEPAAAAAFAGFLNYQDAGKLAEDSVNVVLLTGSGLKDLKAVHGSIHLPKPVSPTLKNLEKLML